MDSDGLRALQAPLKQRYREHPAAALVTLSAAGEVALDQLTCDVPTAAGPVAAGLHRLAGGDGTAACSGDMLLQALVACSGVTMAAVATALNVPIERAQVHVEGDLDFRGTLGVSGEVPVGLTHLRLQYQLTSAADDETLAKLVELTERYCVVLQTLVRPGRLSSSWSRLG